MKIKHIYQKYKVPANLQEHMLRVANLAMHICNHWTGQKLDIGLVRKASLLHDTGSIVKFDLSRPLAKPLNNKSDVNHLAKLQSEFIKKYGDDAHQATAKILEEVNVDKRVIDTILKGVFLNVLEIEKGNNWELKVFHYSDSRVSPTGIVSLKERLNEALGRKPKYQKLPNLQEIIDAYITLEKQIQKNTSVDVLKIKDDTVARNDAKLLNYDTAD